MSQYSINSVVRRNGNGKNHEPIPQKMIGKIKTNLLANRPNQDLLIRTDCCYGLIMSVVPGHAERITQGVEHWRKNGNEFFISDEDTFLKLNDMGVNITADEMSESLLFKFIPKYRKERKEFTISKKQTILELNNMGLQLTTDEVSADLLHDAAVVAVVSPVIMSTSK